MQKANCHKSNYVVTVVKIFSESLEGTIKENIYLKVIIFVKWERPYLKKKAPAKAKIPEAFMNEILEYFARRPWQSNGEDIRYLSMPQLQRTIYCFQISVSQVRFVATCQGTRISRLFDTPFFLMWYKNLKAMSFTVKILIQIN